MKISLLVAAVVLTSLLLSDGTGHAAGSSGAIPPYIASRFGSTSYPAWVSADSVVDQQGKLILNSLPLSIKSVVAAQLEDGTYKKSGCVQFGAVNFDRAGPVKSHASLRDLTENSVGIVLGTVTAIDHGFSLFGPTSLLEIQAEKLKRTRDFAESEYLYFQYPVAEFEVGGYRFCKTDSRWPAVPQIGDRLLIFSFQAPYDLSGQVISPDPEGFEIILERKKDKTLAIPRQLREDPDLVGVKNLDVVKKYTTEYLEKINMTRPAGE